MGLFGSGVLRKQIDELAVQLEGMRRDLEAVKAERSDLKKELSAQENLVREAKESRKKVEKKLEKVTAARSSADQKSVEHKERVDYLEAELATYRNELITVRQELEKTRAELARKSQDSVDEQPVKAPVAAPIVEAEPERTERVEPPRPDHRLERLREQLQQEKENRQSLKDRVNRAEKLGRDADRRRVSELNRAEAVLRDLKHSLRSERRAYKVLQLQFEAVRSRAIEGLPYEEPSLPPMPALEDEPSTPPAVIDVRSVSDEVEPAASEEVSSTAEESEEHSSEEAAAVVETPEPQAEPASVSTEPEAPEDKNPIHPRRRIVDSDA